eukprot:SM000181S03541  [mRNA]  locus=s181:23444:26725:- [translate_table: standard]
MPAGSLELYLQSAHGLRTAHSVFDKADPYAILYCGRETVRSTVRKDQGANPVWNELLHVSVAEGVLDLEVQLYDKNTFQDEFIGSTRIQLAKAFAEGHDSATLPVHGASGLPSGSLSFSVKFTASVSSLPRDTSNSSSPMGIRTVLRLARTLTVRRRSMVQRHLLHTGMLACIPLHPMGSRLNLYTLLQLPLMAHRLMHHKQVLMKLHIYVTNLRPVPPAGHVAPPPKAEGPFKEGKKYGSESLAAEASGGLCPSWLIQQLTIPCYNGPNALAALAIEHDGHHGNPDTTHVVKPAKLPKDSASEQGHTHPLHYPGAAPVTHIDQHPLAAAAHSQANSGYPPPAIYPPQAGMQSWPPAIGAGHPSEPFAGSHGGAPADPYASHIQYASHDGKEDEEHKHDSFAVTSTHDGPAPPLHGYVDPYAYGVATAHYGAPNAYVQGAPAPYYAPPPHDVYPHGAPPPQHGAPTHAAIPYGAPPPYDHDQSHEKQKKKDKVHSDPYASHSSDPHYCGGPPAYGADPYAAHGSDPYAMHGPQAPYGAPYGTPHDPSHEKQKKKDKHGDQHTLHGSDPHHSGGPYAGHGGDPYAMHGPPAPYGTPYGTPHDGCGGHGGKPDKYKEHEKDKHEKNKHKSDYLHDAKKAAKQAEKLFSHFT